MSDPTPSFQVVYRSLDDLNHPIIQNMKDQQNKKTSLGKDQSAPAQSARNRFLSFFSRNSNVNHENGTSKNGKSNHVTQKIDERHITQQSFSRLFDEIKACFPTPNHESLNSLKESAEINKRRADWSVNSGRMVETLKTEAAVWLNIGCYASENKKWYPGPALVMGEIKQQAKNWFDQQKKQGPGHSMFRVNQYGLYGDNWLFSHAYFEDFWAPFEKYVGLFLLSNGAHPFDFIPTSKTMARPLGFYQPYFKSPQGETQEDVDVGDISQIKTNSDVLLEKLRLRYAAGDESVLPNLNFRLLEQWASASRLLDYIPASRHKTVDMTESTRETNMDHLMKRFNVSPSPSLYYIEQKSVTAFLNSSQEDAEVYQRQAQSVQDLAYGKWSEEEAKNIILSWAEKWARGEISPFEETLLCCVTTPESLRQILKEIKIEKLWVQKETKKININLKGLLDDKDLPSVQFEKTKLNVALMEVIKNPHLYASADHAVSLIDLHPSSLPYVYDILKNADHLSGEEKMLLYPAVINMLNEETLRLKVLSVDENIHNLLAPDALPFEKEVIKAMSHAHYPLPQSRWDSRDADAAISWMLNDLSQEIKKLNVRSLESSISIGRIAEHQEDRKEENKKEEMFWSSKWTMQTIISLLHCKGTWLTGPVLEKYIEAKSNSSQHQWPRQTAEDLDEAKKTISSAWLSYLDKSSLGEYHPRSLQFAQYAAAQSYGELKELISRGFSSPDYFDIQIVSPSSPQKDVSSSAHLSSSGQDLHNLDVIKFWFSCRLRANNSNQQYIKHLESDVTEWINDVWAATKNHPNPELTQEKVTQDIQSFLYWLSQEWIKKHPFSHRQTNDKTKSQTWLQSVAESKQGSVLFKLLNKFTFSHLKIIHRSQLPFSVKQEMLSHIINNLKNIGYGHPGLNKEAWLVSKGLPQEELFLYTDVLSDHVKKDFIKKKVDVISRPQDWFSQKISGQSLYYLSQGFEEITKKQRENPSLPVYACLDQKSWDELNKSIDSPNYFITAEVSGSKIRCALPQLFIDELRCSPWEALILSMLSQSRQVFSAKIYRNKNISSGPLKDLVHAPELLQEIYGWSGPEMGRLPQWCLSPIDRLSHQHPQGQMKNMWKHWHDFFTHTVLPDLQINPHCHQTLSPYLSGAEQNLLGQTLICAGIFDHPIFDPERNSFGEAFRQYIVDKNISSLLSRQDFIDLLDNLTSRHTKQDNSFRKTHYFGALTSKANLDKKENLKEISENDIYWAMALHSTLFSGKEVVKYLKYQDLNGKKESVTRDYGVCISFDDAQWSFENNRISFSEVNSLSALPLNNVVGKNQDVDVKQDVNLKTTDETLTLDVPMLNSVRLLDKNDALEISPPLPPSSYRFSK